MSRASHRHRQPATPAQVSLLGELGVGTLPTGFTAGQASDLIDRKKRERQRERRVEHDAQPATAAQLASLDSLGVEGRGDLTRAEASRLIDRKRVERAERRAGRSDQPWGPRRLGRRRGRRRGGLKGRTK